MIISLKEFHAFTQTHLVLCWRPLERKATLETCCEGLCVKSFPTFSPSAKHHGGSASQEVVHGGGAEQRSCWGPCLIGDLKTSGCSGCTGLKRWPAFHSREFRTLQPTRWDSGLIYELELSPEKSTGSRHRDWKSHPSQRLSHSLTTPNPPRDNCTLLRYRALKWSWQSSIYQVIWARRDGVYCSCGGWILSHWSSFCPLFLSLLQLFFPSFPPSQHSCRQIKNRWLALETVKYGRLMEGKAVPHIWRYILAARGLQRPALTSGPPCTTTGRRGENPVMKPPLYSLQAMFSRV